MSQPEPEPPVGNATPLWGSPEPLSGRCGARLKPRATGQRYCTRHPMPNGRCYRHGGATPSGIAASGYRHGLRSAIMPARMQESYEAYVRDPEILSLRREIATHRALVEDLRRQLAAGGQDTGADLDRAWRRFKAAHARGNTQALSLALSDVDAAVVGRTREDGLRRELRKENELVRKLTRDENLRMEMLHQMVSREQAMLFVRALSVGVKEAVDQYVADAGVRTKVLRAVSARFEQLAHRRGPADADPRRLGAGAVDPEADDGE